MKHQLFRTEKQHFGKDNFPALMNKVNGTDEMNLASEAGGYNLNRLYAFGLGKHPFGAPFKNLSG